MTTTDNHALQARAGAEDSAPATRNIRPYSQAQMGDHVVFPTWNRQWCRHYLPGRG
ncbi:MAG TPA: hypothetical protein VFA09_06735 [Ktedonobacteraceae bacterium]|nr:hypothetical protein [Ktedonobacteraceae bacterium]